LHTRELDEQPVIAEQLENRFAKTGRVNAAFDSAPQGFHLVRGRLNGLTCSLIDQSRLINEVTATLKIKAEIQSERSVLTPTFEIAYSDGLKAENKPRQRHQYANYNQ
jgi:hypothetical protein